MEEKTLSYKEKALKNGKQTLALQVIIIFAFVGMMLMRTDEVVVAFGFFAFFGSLIMLALMLDYREANRLFLYPKGIVAVVFNAINYLMLIYLFDYATGLFMMLSMLFIIISTYILIKQYMIGLRLNEADYINYIRHYPVTLDTMKRHVYVTMNERLKRIVYLGVIYAIIVSLFPEAHASFMVLFLMIVYWQVAMSFYLFKYDKWFTIKHLFHLTSWILVYFVLVHFEVTRHDIMGILLFVIIAYAPLFAFVSSIEGQLRKLDEKQRFTNSIQD